MVCELHLTKTGLFPKEDAEVTVFETYVPKHHNQSSDSCQHRVLAQASPCKALHANRILPPAPSVASSDLHLGAGVAENVAWDPRVSYEEPVYVLLFFSSSLGNEQMKVENFEAAVHLYGKAIELNPANAVYFCNRYCRPCSEATPASLASWWKGQTAGL